MDELNEIVMLYDMGLIEINEMDAAIEGYWRRSVERETPVRRSSLFGNLNLDSMSDSEVKMAFRFRREHLRLLTELLGIPEDMVIPQRLRVNGTTALCILLRRLAYPNRLSDLEKGFGMSSSAISRIFNFMVDYIVDRKGHLLDHLDSLSWLTQRLEYYSQAIARKGSPLNNCWGFIDGTARQVCRPSQNQKHYFSGHKRYHCVKYQGILTPDGIIVSLQGAYKGTRHDAGILARCRIEEYQLRPLSEATAKKYVIYGDPAYAVSDVLLSPFPAARTERAKRFNSSMSRCRQAVEWGFGKIVNIFAFVDFHKNQKLLLQDVPQIYKAATLLTNCHTCLYGGLVSDYFETNPITLERYLS